jgi:hypothetical protein
MGKRSYFKRVPRDFYPTPYSAVEPLLPHLQAVTNFCEPCAGSGALVDHLAQNGHVCTYACDIEPQREDVARQDAFNISAASDFFITNPPWDRRILHGLIAHLSDIAPTWLLFDADWKHTKQSAEYMSRCVKIVSVGRVKWFPETNMTGKDNCAWCLFDKAEPSRRPLFEGRQG